MRARVRLGTRGSRLALAQAESIKASLLAADGGLAVEIVTIKTSGDLGERERLGAFVREIQESLLQEDVDLALHCLKDLPTEHVPGLRLSAFCVREDPRDSLISRGGGLHELPRGAIVGTGSVRRTSQLLARRPDLVFRPLVGNIDTRLRKLLAGEYDAIVLAQAGLLRLGVLDGWQSGDYRELVVIPFSAQELLPAPGQAVLVLESRESDAASHLRASALEHADTRRCAEAERAFLREFGGGCSVPVAALATVNEEALELTGLVASPDGKTVLREVAKGAADDGMRIARSLAASLGVRGAFGLFEGRFPEGVEQEV